MSIIAAADGSALGNPGPAGWGWYVDEGRWASGGWPHGTNNMGELMAVLDLLRQSAGTDEELLVLCDSTYVINVVTKWMPGWKKRGWRKGDGQPVQNLELVQGLDAAVAGRAVRFEWVKGHSGHELNDHADRLATAAALAFKEGRPPDSGPGFGTGFSAADAEPDLFSELEAGFEGDLRRLDELADEERVVALERSLLTDEVRSDPAAVAALLHPDWTEIGSSGRWFDRDEMLARIGPLDGPVELEVLRVDRIGDDVLLLVWRAHHADRTVLRSSVWQRSAGRWQQRFHQGTTEP